MPRFSANLSLMFTEVDFLERFAAAAKAGFRGIEYFFPYAYDKDQLLGALERSNHTQVLFSLPPGDWEAGEVGIACHPHRVGEFQEGVGLGVEYARVLKCRVVNCIAGITPQGVDPGLLRETYVSNLKFAAAELQKVGTRLVIEPVNTNHRPGFYLHHTAQAASVIKEVGSGNLGLEYDVFHSQVMEGDLARTIEENLGIIDHIQIADNPGHHEPGTGEINYDFLLPFIDRIGYTGWVGCEYEPEANTIEGLGWMTPYLSSQRVGESE